VTDVEVAVGPAVLVTVAVFVATVVGTVTLAVVVML